MTTADRPAARWPIYLGWTLNVLLALFVGMGGVMDLLKPPFVVKGTQRAGYPESVLVPLGVVTLVCALLYVIPRTSVLGAILLTGYFGGAVSTHVRQVGHVTDEPVIAQMCMAFAFGVAIWVALVLRMPRLRALTPIVR